MLLAGVAPNSASKVVSDWAYFHNKDFFKRGVNLAAYTNIELEVLQEVVDRESRALEMLQLDRNGTPTKEKLLEIWEVHCRNLASSFKAVSNLVDHANKGFKKLQCIFAIYKNANSMLIKVEDKHNFSNEFRKKFDDKIIGSWWPEIDVRQIVMVRRINIKLCH